MKKLILLSLCLLVATFAVAQTQRGFVKTKGRMVNGQLVPGQGLPGATVNIQGGSSVGVRNANGSFSFLVPAKTFMVQSVQKIGYELVDPDVTTRPHQQSENDLYLVMETPEQQMEDQLEAEEKISRTLREQLNHARREITRLKEENKITEEEYRQRIAKLMEDQKNNKTLIEEMARQYAQMDYDQMDSLNQRISDAILNGRLTEADSLLRSKGDMRSRIAEIRKEQQAEAQEEAELAQRQQNLDAIKAGTQKKVEDAAADCYKYFNNFRLANQYDSARYYIELRTTLDTLNVLWLLDAHNYIQTYLADYERSFQYAENALRIAQNENPENKSLVAVCYNSLATDYEKLDSLSKSLEIFNNSLNVIISTPPVDYSKLALCMSNIGIVLSKQGKYDESLKYYQRALSIRKDSLEIQPKEIADCYESIGTTLHRQGKNSEALKALEEALSICPKQNNETSLASILNSLGVVSETLGNNKRALDYYERSLNIKKILYGNEHPQNANTINNMAIVYSKLGNDSIALILFKQALNIRLRVFGNIHSSVGDSYNNIGIILYNQKNYMEALAAYKNSLAIREKILGPQHKSVADSYNNIGLLYEEMGDHDNAINNIEHGLNIRLAIFDETNVNIASSYVNLGIVAFNMNNYQKALDYYMAAKKIYEKTYKYNHPIFITIFRNIGASYRHMGNEQEAINYYQMILNYIPSDHKDRDYYQGIVQELKSRHQ